MKNYLVILLGVLLWGFAIGQQPIHKVSKLYIEEYEHKKSIKILPNDSGYTYMEFHATLDSAYIGNPETYIKYHILGLHADFDLQITDTLFEGTSAGITTDSNWPHLIEAIQSSTGDIYITITSNNYAIHLLKFHSSGIFQFDVYIAYALDYEGLHLAPPALKIHNGLVNIAYESGENTHLIRIDSYGNFHSHYLYPTNMTDYPWAKRIRLFDVTDDGELIHEFKPAAATHGFIVKDITGNALFTKTCIEDYRPVASYKDTSSNRYYFVYIDEWHGDIYFAKYNSNFTSTIFFKTVNSSTMAPELLRVSWFGRTGPNRISLAFYANSASNYDDLAPYIIQFDTLGNLISDRFLDPGFLNGTDMYYSRTQQEVIYNKADGHLLLKTKIFPMSYYNHYHLFSEFDPSNPGGTCYWLDDDINLVSSGGPLLSNFSGIPIPQFYLYFGLYVDTTNGYNFIPLDFYDMCGTEIGINPVDELILNIYPNPASSFVNIELPYDNLRLTLFDMNGKLIWTKTQLLAGLNQLDISGITSGIYVLKIDGLNLHLDKKLVVNN